MSIKSEQIKEYAADLGFVLCGISEAAPVSADVAIGYSRYIATGAHARMEYLTRNIEKRLDIGRLVDGARSVISCAVSYNNPEPVSESNDELYIARYARFTDYHNIIRARLKLLADRIGKHNDNNCYTRCFVDTAPLLEKYFACKAGLGWVGKNNLLINARYGSQILLGEIVINYELDYDHPVENACGQCSLCIDHCPGGAIGKDCFNSNKCVSYHTIESEEVMPCSMVKATAGHVFGCDRCQTICPYNQKAEPNTDPELMFRYSSISYVDLMTMSESQFNEKYSDTPLSRAGLERLRYIASLSRCV